MTAFPRLAQQLLITLCFTFSLLLTSQVQALAQPLPDNAPEEMLTALMVNIVTNVRERRDELNQDPSKVYQLAEDVLLVHIDTDRIAKLVLGLYWKDSDEVQRSTFKSEFANLITRFYIKALVKNPDNIDLVAKHGDTMLSFNASRLNSAGTKAIVRASFQLPGSSPLPIQFRVYNHSGVWKIYDVAVDGVSLVTTYRKSLSNQIRQAGVDGMIGMLKERNKKLRDLPIKSN